ncbi:hypothetical protein POTOM_005552 [Populus tomentosa]|uniref:Uncharacterized protein n=1 Tax=Populus tomentosa TaxID=118781 RepID=A0A8X8DFU3_POPTO|nr:hypothetical protein POTOM_005552 [Populus tomentosa]
MKPKSIKEASIIEDLPSNSSTTTTSRNGCSKIDGLDFEGVDISASACSTPKAERFRIPEIQTCPPAPRKERIISNCSLQRRPIAFFAPPDLELFFFYAIHDGGNGIVLSDCGVSVCLSLAPHPQENPMK